MPNTPLTDKMVKVLALLQEIANDIEDKGISSTSGARTRHCRENAETIRQMARRMAVGFANNACHAEDGHDVLTLRETFKGYDV